MSESSRLRPLPWLIALALAVLGSLQACDCGSTGADTRRFACIQDAECASGFVCRLGECQPAEEPDGGVDSGVPDGGQPDGGQPDGGQPDGGQPDGGGTDGGPDAGPPDGGTTGPNKLALINAPLTLQAGRCSAALTVETEDSLGNAILAGARTTINLASAPSTGFTFFSDSGCLFPTNSLTLQANRSRVNFYVKGITAQSVQITASATNWLPASQTETIIPGPPSVFAFLTPSQTLPAGGCSAAVDFETRDSSGNVSPVTAQTRVRQGAPFSAGISFFSDSECATAATEVVLAAGASRGRFYFKGRTGGTFSISVSTTTPGFNVPNQSETILPVVRTGTCSLPSGGSSVTCPISPAQLDMAKTLLLFQASSSDNTPDASSVRCSLSALNAITCSRNSSDGASQAIWIQWQTAELVSGLTVQHLQATCGGTPVTELPIQPVSSVQQTFLLVSSQKDGANQSDDEYYAASLFQADPNSFHVDLEFSVDCAPSWRASVQVVELEGANVTRGLTGSMTDTELVVSNLPAANLASTALLFTYRTSGASGPAICDRVLRGELTSPTSITFTRGAGAAGCTDTTIDSISWERIEFGTRASTQHFLVSMDEGVQTATVPITAVDTTRTLAFATGQMQSGQGGGETSFADDDVIGASVGWHVLTSPTTLDVAREFDGGVAQWNSTVLQLVP